MKIDFNTKYNISPYRNISRQSALTSENMKTSQNFDGIILSSAPDVSAEKTFADSLSSRLSLEVKQPVSADKIKELQKQIEQGSYEIDINTIADRIMLY